MRLKLEIGGQVIASMPLNVTKAGDLEYVYSQRSLLVEACADSISGKNESPVFFIEVSSKMNQIKKRK